MTILTAHACSSVSASAHPFSKKSCLEWPYDPEKVISQWPVCHSINNITATNEGDSFTILVNVFRNTTANDALHREAAIGLQEALSSSDCATTDINQVRFRELATFKHDPRRTTDRNIEENHV
jgi:hypothetical protein